MLKLNQLLAFNELMLVGSVSEAARNLHRTQSSISATIAGLERDLGLQLFERRNGRLFPVPEAKYLHSECSEILRRLDTVSHNMHQIKALETGTVSIASMPGPSFFFLPDIVARHGKAHPAIQSTVVSRSSEGVYRLMAAQQHDIGIADYMPTLSAETSLIETTVFKFKCLCALPASDPLSERATITPQDLSGRPLATLWSEHPVFEDTARAFAQSGAEMKASFMCQYFIPLLTFVEQGIACAIVDPISARSYRLYNKGEPLIRFRPLVSDIHFEVALIKPVHRPASSLANSFFERLGEEFQSIVSGEGEAQQQACSR